MLQLICQQIWKIQLRPQDWPHSNPKGNVKECSNYHTNALISHVASESESCLVVSNSLWSHGLHSPWNSPGQNTGVDTLSLLQGIFPTQGSNPSLPHYRWILSHKGSPTCSKVMFKILQVRLQQYMYQELPHVQAGFRNSIQRSNCQHATEHIKKQENSRRTSTFASLTTIKPLTMWITTNCGKFLKR